MIPHVLWICLVQTVRISGKVPKISIKKKVFCCRIRNHTPTELVIWICSAAASIRTAGVVALIHVVFYRVEQNAS